MKKDMADSKEQNLCRLIIGVSGHGVSVQREYLKFHWTSEGHGNIQGFLSANFHVLFDLWKPSSKCSCGRTGLRSGSAILNKVQWDVLFENDTTHKCRYRPRGTLNVSDLDVTLVSCIVKNVVIYNPKFLEEECIRQGFVDVSAFLDANIHIFLGIWKKIASCACGYVLVKTGVGMITNATWNRLYKQDPSSQCGYSAISSLPTTNLDQRIIECLLNNSKSRLLNAIAEIIKVRNFVAHYHSAAMPNNEFEQKWKELTRAVEAIASQISTACKDTFLTDLEVIKQKCLDPSEASRIMSTVQIISQGIGEEIVHLQSGIGRMQEKLVLCVENKIGSLKKEIQSKATEGQRHRVTEENLQQRDVSIENSKKQINQIVQGGLFVTTRPFRATENVLKEQNVAFLIGRPGDGKSFSAYHVIASLTSDENTKNKKKPILISSPEEWLKFVSPRQNLAIIIDNLLGTYDVRYSQVYDWSKVNDHMTTCLTKTSNINDNKLLVVMRKNIFLEWNHEISRFGFFQKSQVVDFSSNDCCLTEADKRAIMNVYGCEQYLPDADIEKIINAGNIIGFPECCKLVTVNSNFQSAEFFLQAKSMIEKEMENMYRMEPNKFATLSTLSVFGGTLSYEEMTETNTMEIFSALTGRRSMNISTNTFSDEAQFLKETYISFDDDSRAISFSHNSIKEIVFIIVFTHYPEILISRCNKGTFSYLTNRGSPVNITKELYGHLLQRLLDMLSVDLCEDVVNIICEMKLWKEQDFRNDFESIFFCGFQNSHELPFIRYVLRSGNTILLDICYKHFEDTFAKYIESNEIIFDIVNAISVEMDDDQETRNSDLEMFDFLEQKGFTAYREDNDNCSILHYACQKQKLRLIEHIFLKHRDILSYLLSGSTVIQYCAQSGSTEIFDFMLQHSNVCERLEDYDNLTLLLTACEHGKVELCKHIVDVLPTLKKSVNAEGWSALHFASKVGSLDIFTFLFESGLDVNQTTNAQKSVLHIACQYEHMTLVKYIVTNFPDLKDKIDETGSTSLHVCASSGSLEIFKLLIDHGLDPHQVTNSGNTVLHIASQQKIASLACYITETYPDLVTTTNSLNMIPLHSCAMFGSAEIFDCLVTNGSNVNQLCLESSSSVFHIACQCNDEQMVHHIVKHYPKIKYERDNKGNTALPYSILSDSITNFLYLCENGFDILDTNAFGQTVFHVACQLDSVSPHLQYIVENYVLLAEVKDNRGMVPVFHCLLNGSFEIFKFLSENGISIDKTLGPDRCHLVLFAISLEKKVFLEYIVDNIPDLKDRSDNNIIHFCAAHGSVEMFTALLEKNFDINCLSKAECTALHMACSKANIPMIEYIVENYPEMKEKKDRDGWTALHALSVQGSVDGFKVLLQHGFIVEDVAENGCTCLHLACKHNRLDLVQFIVTFFPEMIHKSDNDNWTTLHYNAIGGSVKIFKLLIENGALANDLTNDNCTVLHLACCKGNTMLVLYIVENFPVLKHMVNRQGWTALHFAAGRSLEIFEYLVSEGLLVTQVTSEKLNILHIACLHNSVSLVKHIVKNYPELMHETGPHGFTAIYICASKGSVEVFDILAEAYNKKESATALEIAILTNNTTLVEHILRNAP